ncbi:MAG: hypothetical protein ACTHWH_07815, partial [Marinobacter sp.]
RSLRTRSGLTMVQQRINGTDGLEGATFDLNSVVDHMLSNQSYAGQVLRNDLVNLCKRNPLATLDGVGVDLAEACRVLEA